MNHPPVLIFSGRLLPASETFVKAQAEGLHSFTPYYAGARRVEGLSMPTERTIVVNAGGYIAKAQELLFKQMGYAPQFYRTVRRLQPKLIHAHFGVCGALALPLAKAIQRPLIVTFHGFDASMTDAYARRDSISTRVYLRRRDALKQNAARFIAVSQFIKEKLIAKGFAAHKIWVHYIGIDTHQFQPDEAIARQRVVLFVGRLVEKKGCKDLIQAMAKVQASDPNIQLVVIGDGPLRTELETQARQALQQYQFLGLQPSSVVKEWMNRAMVLAVPSVTTADGDTEGLPTVVAEAQAMGLPVVGTVHAGIPEAVLHEKTGLLCAERDWQAIADHILTLFNQPQTWQSFSHKGRERMLNQFDLSTQIQKLEEFYHEVLSNPGFG